MKSLNSTSSKFVRLVLAASVAAIGATLCSCQTTAPYEQKYDMAGMPIEEHNPVLEAEQAGLILIAGGLASQRPAAAQDAKATAQERKLARQAKKERARLIREDEKRIREGERRIQAEYAENIRRAEAEAARDRAAARARHPQAPQYGHGFGGFEMDYSGFKRAAEILDRPHTSVFAGQNRGHH
ncbi:MAG: hypothetical protein AAF585_27655 [Verrucomicrobiota bacterium]